MAVNLVNLVVAFLATLTVVHFPVISVASYIPGKDLPPGCLFLFGDSYFDLGNKNYLVSYLNPSNLWPYGMSWDYPSGRYSDGKIVPDLLASFWGIPNPIPPYFDPNGNISRGVGFAVADATVLGTPSPETLTLSEQVQKFAALKSNWDDPLLSVSVFMIQIGTDDYLDFLRTNPGADGSAQLAFVTSVLTKIKAELLELYNNGARKFAYTSLPTLGCLPIVRQEQNLTGDACYEPANQIAQLHNKGIRPMLADLAKNNPGFQYSYFDFYGALIPRLNSTVIDLPKKSYSVNLPWRIMNSVDACCGIGTHNAYGCGSFVIHSKLCVYQRAYLWYDGRHNTEKQNEEMAHLYFGGDTNVVVPMNFRELISFPPYLSMLEY